MNLTRTPLPNLLIENGCNLDHIPEKVLDTKYLASAEDFTSCKSRGTRVCQTDSGYHICSWQKLQVRFQKIDQYQPMIVRMKLDHARTITEIELDQRSVGSQGLTCAMSYLQRNLERKVIGLTLNAENTDRFLATHLSCFHLQELLMGALSFLNHFDCQEQETFDEVEATEFITDGHSHITNSYQRFSDGTGLHWSVAYEDALKRIIYDNEGYVGRLDNIRTTFRIADEIVFEERLNGKNPKQCLIVLTKLAFRIWHILGKRIFPDESIEFCHSCSYPFTLMGLIILGFAVEKYPENYNLVQHVVRALQRKGKTPVCVGVINDLNEAKQFFKDFRAQDMF